MGKRIFVLTIVLLYQLTSINYASAGFYDWLISKPSSNIPLVNHSIADINNISFDKIFSWNNRIPENTESIKLQFKNEEEPKLKYEIVGETLRQVTAYNVGDPYQTDSTPCIGAYSKVDLCEEIGNGVKVCAANFVPLNTTLRIYTSDEESFDCIVWDRMNSRYTSRVDIAMSLSEKQVAKEFGLNYFKVQILKESSI